MRVVDLRCNTCGKRLEDYFCLTNPECCGVKMETDWSAGVCPGVSTWNINFTYEGIAYKTEAEWKSHLANIEKNTGKKVVVTENNKHIAKERSDEAKHRAYTTMKKAGVDDSMKKAIQAEKRIVKSKGEKVSKIFKE